MDRYASRQRASAGISGPDQSQMDLEFFLGQTSRQKRHHLLSATPAKARRQQQNSRAFHS
jgi:hypothetical protein